MKKGKSILFALACSAMLLTGCDDKPAPQENNAQAQSRLAQQAADSVTITDNQEIDNLKRRLELMSKPGGQQYVVLIGPQGNVIAYDQVEGKVTSGGKRLRRPYNVERFNSGGQYSTYSYLNVPSPSDNGVWGNAGDYIFYWTVSGAYRQWSGQYLLSDQPIRLNVQPIVIDILNKN